MRVKELNQEKFMDTSETSLDNLSKIINDYSKVKVESHLFQSHTIDIKQARIEAQGKWVSSISALETLLLSYLEPIIVNEEICQGIILSAPTPILCHPALIKILHTGIFTLQTNTLNLWKQFKLPADINCSSQINSNTLSVMELPILPQDSLASEQFCLILTSQFSLMIVLGENSLGFPTFQFTFDPEVNYKGWLRLRFGLDTLNYSQLFELDQLVQKFIPVFPRCQVIEEFSKRGIVYINMIEPRATTAGGDDNVNEEAPSTSSLFKDKFNGMFISSGGYTPETAEVALNDNKADAIMFGRWFIANPDLPERIAKKAELNKYDRATFYGGNDKGYTDYPFLS